mmetsp:Transcript_37241/g.43468  ORF Transcript_37241/g.43468 Transcript_37241/m.43468 type:complete len:92 (+) Transcript_37241:377-652(+)
MEDYSISSMISTTGTNSNTTSAVKDFSGLNEVNKQLQSQWKITKLIPEENKENDENATNKKCFSIGNLTITLNSNSSLKGFDNLKTLKIVL